MTPDTHIALCPECGSDAAAVADCHAFVDDHWSLLIRCGECGKWRELVVPGTAMRELEALVMDGWHAIERELQRIAEPADRS
jgi:hypothetical protein